MKTKNVTEAQQQNQIERRIELLEKENALLREKRDLFESYLVPKEKVKNEEIKEDFTLSHLFNMWEKHKEEMIEQLKKIQTRVFHYKYTRSEVVLSIEKGCCIEHKEAEVIYSRMKHLFTSVPSDELKSDFHVINHSKKIKTNK